MKVPIVNVQTSPSFRTRHTDGFFGTRAGKKVILVRDGMKPSTGRVFPRFDALP
jgi:hypothetical protein